jgi:hypothetical protein
LVPASELRKRPAKVGVGAAGRASLSMPKMPLDLLA